MPVLRRRKRKVFFGVLSGVVVGVMLSAAAGYFYFFNDYETMKKENKNLKSVVALSKEQTVERSTIKLPVVNKPLKTGDKITKDDINYIDFYEEYCSEQFISNEEEIFGKCLKVDLSINQPLTKKMFISLSDVTDDLREMEFSMLKLPQKLEKQDYVDIRICFPTGLDYIILSKKKVVDIQRISDETELKETVWFNLDEEELLRVSSALVDAYLVEDSKLYAIEYVAPVMQNAAKVTYPVNNDVLEQIKNNPNLLSNAINELELKRREELEQSLKDLEDKLVNK